MHEMTKQNLQTAFAGESQAHMKYLIFAEKAKKEGKPNIGRLFEAISYAERVHASGHLKILDVVNDTVKNLEAAIAGETYEVNEMYPAYHEEAKAQGEKAAEKSTYYALEAEKIHVKMYQNAKEAAQAGKDLDLKEVYICPVCGYTVESEAPDFCPVCGAKKDIFKKF